MRIERVCPICGKSYIVETRRLKQGHCLTCSRKCGYKLCSQTKKAQSSYVRLVCQECGKPFNVLPGEARKGRRYCSQSCVWQHRSRRVVLICGFCKEPFEVKKYRVDSAKYCSTGCAHNAQRGRKRKNRVDGEVHCKANNSSSQYGSQYHPESSQVKTICEYCEQEFYVMPSRLKWGRGKYCSRECQYAAARKRGRESQARVTRKCLHCGKEFQVYKKVLHNGRKGIGTYCSRKCRDEHRVGQDHPQFIHGNNAVSRGPNWQAQKRKARKRDEYICQHCGIARQESKIPLDVHHKIPFRFFEDYKKANRLSNLITLCRSCHRKAEIELQKVERGMK